MNVSVHQFFIISQKMEVAIKVKMPDIMIGICTAVIMLALMPVTAYAQEFYGEGNVLIAVDVGEYAENEDVYYHEGTMGELTWGADAPRGTGTRPAFNPHSGVIRGGFVPVTPYETEDLYQVGQKIFLSFYRFDDPDYIQENRKIPVGSFPAEVFDQDGNRLFRTSDDNMSSDQDGNILFDVPCELSDGELHPCMDFLEFECLEITQCCTIWQYTGVAYSTRTGFDIEEYVGAVEMEPEEQTMLSSFCDGAYLKEARLSGDPGWEDRSRDRDGKAAGVIMRLNYIPGAGGFSEEEKQVFDFSAFDCVCIGYNVLNTAYRNNDTDKLGRTLCHEFNHYILMGLIGHADSSGWLAETFAEASVHYAGYEDISIESQNFVISDLSSRLRLIPGMMVTDSSLFYDGPYALGPLLLRYIERISQGTADGAIWTEYLSGLTAPYGDRVSSDGLTAESFDTYLRTKTGETLDAWMAQFIAALIAGEEEGLYCAGDEKVRQAYQLNPSYFFRDWRDYGQDLGISADSAADIAVVDTVGWSYKLNSVQGGGTAYAYYNAEGGSVAITGADDRWYFFAVNMELPDHTESIRISDAETLAKIGRDDKYPLSGSYILTGDIDLKGDETHQWTPIGDFRHPFTGTFDGNGHTISGLFIDNDKKYQGLFGHVAGNAGVQHLTVMGSVRGITYISGIAGYNDRGTITDCTSFVTVYADKDTGGITGYNYLGEISDCINHGTVTCSLYCGGITGYNNFGSVTDCLNTGDISGIENVGGITGIICGNRLTGCSNTGRVTGEECAGGIAGVNRDAGIIENCCNTGIIKCHKGVGGIAGWNAEDSSISRCRSYTEGLPVVGIDNKGLVEECYYPEGNTENQDEDKEESEDTTWQTYRGKDGVSGVAALICSGSDNASTGTAVVITTDSGEAKVIKLVSCDRKGNVDITKVCYRGQYYTVTEIGDDAAKDNCMLKTLTLGAGVRRIGKRAFEDCTKLTAVNLPGKITIGAGAFRKDVKLLKMRFSSSPAELKIGKSAFRKTGKPLTFMNSAGITAETKKLIREQNERVKFR